MSDHGEQKARSLLGPGKLAPAAALTLHLLGEPELELGGWWIADGHWDDPPGVGVLVVVSPEMAERLRAGDVAANMSVLMVGRHCCEQVLAHAKEHLDEAVRAQ